MTGRAAPAGEQPLPDLIAWTCWVGGATASSAARCLRISERSARGRLEAAVGRGLARRERPLAGRPSLYLPTAAAMRAAGLQGAPAPSLSPSGAEHALACAAVAGELSRRYPQSRILGEPVLRLAERAGAGLSVRVGVDRCGRPLAHRPDLAVWPSGGAGLGPPAVDAAQGARHQARARPLVVEVELTVKAPERLRAICLAWARSRGVGGVLYVVAPAVRAPLARAIAAACAGERIAVLALAEADGRQERSVPGAA
jgi:hypothetical protein